MDHSALPDEERAGFTPPRRAVERITRPLERFLHVEATAGLVLLAAAVVALVWANAAPQSYEGFWHAHVSVAIGGFGSNETLHFWVNDGLMVVFFFVVGLEIRREVHQGELSELRRAALPAAAAIGGMLAPAIIFLLLNGEGSTRRGWGVPMATDIAFAVGALALLGKRVPAALRVLLLALAIIDDIGAIIVIAVFYSGGVSLAGLAIAVGGMAGVLVLRHIGVRRSLVYVVPGFVIWLGCLRAGIHPTIAGVVLGLMTPPKAWFGERGFLDVTARAIADVRARLGDGERSSAPEGLIEPLARVSEAQREAIPPTVRLQTMLHPWVAFLIMPIFALANAGVAIGGLDAAPAGSSRVFAGIVLGLVVGKPIGVLAVSYLAVRSGVALRPRGVAWRGIGVVGGVAGIGFTMAIFIANLAFEDAQMLAIAKLAVLVASVVAGVAAFVAGRALLPQTQERDVAASPSEAEASTEA